MLYRGAYSSQKKLYFREKRRNREEYDLDQHIQAMKQGFEQYLAIQNNSVQSTQILLTTSRLGMDRMSWYPILSWIPDIRLLKKYGKKLEQNENGSFFCITFYNSFFLLIQGSRIISTNTRPDIEFYTWSNTRYLARSDIRPTLISGPSPIKV